MQYAILETIHITRNVESGRVIVWTLGYFPGEMEATQVFDTVEQAHTWLVREGYQPDPYIAPLEELGGLYEDYYKLVPVVML